MQGADPPRPEAEPLAQTDFERMRCSRCKGYLNCPPIVAFLGRDNYAECGRCFNEEVAKREGLSPVRNRSLELLASITPFPCKNLKHGCSERRIWPQIEVHEAECLHRAFTCPLTVLKSCTYEGGVQKLVKHFQDEHPDLLLINGLLNETFDENFENHYLVQQNSSLFVFQVKNDVNVNKAWFDVNLLETRDASEFNLEFTGEISESSFVVKRNVIFKPITIINVDEALEIDLKAVRTLLRQPQNIKCKVFLNVRFAGLPSSDLLKEIQCPACWDFMKGKIFLCKNGHNVCSKCKEFVIGCPTCRENILDVRNLSLEKVITHALFPCKNHSAGCIYVGTLDETVYHFNHCSLTPPECAE